MAEPLPGPASPAGLAWLARVGPAPIELRSSVMGWCLSVAGSNAQRLEPAAGARGQRLDVGAEKALRMRSLPAPTVTRLALPMWVLDAEQALASFANRLAGARPLSTRVCASAALRSRSHRAAELKRPRSNGRR